MTFCQLVTDKENCTEHATQSKQQRHQEELIAALSNIVKDEERKNFLATCHSQREQEKEPKD